MHTPPIMIPAHGCVPGVPVVVVDDGGAVVVVVAAVVVVTAVLVVVVDVGVGGLVVVVVVLVPPVTGRVVEVVVDDVVVDEVLDVVLDGVIGGSLDGTHRTAKPPSKNRRRGCATRAAKHTRESAPVTIGWGVDGEHNNHGSSTETLSASFTVTGAGGAKCTEVRDG